MKQFLKMLEEEGITLSLVSHPLFTLPRPTPVQYSPREPGLCSQ